MFLGSKEFNIFIPKKSSSIFELIIETGFKAKGLVSIQLMKILSGLASLLGILLKGLVRNDVHKPDSNKPFLTLFVSIDWVIL